MAAPSTSNDEFSYDGTNFTYSHNSGAASTITEYDFNTHKPPAPSNNIVAFNLDRSEGFYAKSYKYYDDTDNDDYRYISVVGGYSDNSTVKNNQLGFNKTLLWNKSTADDTFYDYVAAGFALKGDATGNNLVVKNSAFTFINGITSIAGGHSHEGSANNNIADVSDNSDTSTVYGGRADGRGSANSNTANVSASKTGVVYGGFSELGDANSNTVNISKDSTVGDVYGGSSNGENANNNSVNVSDSTTSYSVFGGKSNVSASDNQVKISNSTIGKSSGSVIGGSASDGKANNNIVDISNSSILGDVSGGGANGGEASNNQVKIASNSSVESVCGGRSLVNANNNSVDVSDSAVSDSVIAGHARFTGDARGNTVKLSNSSVKHDVYGGYAENGLGDGASADEINNITFKNASGNTVTIVGGSVGGNIVGGYATRYKYISDYDAHHVFDEKYVTDGNTLNIGESLANPTPVNQLSANNVLGFETVNFYLPSDVKHNDVALKLNTTDSTDLSQTTVNAYLNGANGLNEDSKIHLIQTAGSLTAPKDNGAEQAGVTNVNIGRLINVKGYVGLSEDAKNLDLSFKGEQPLPPASADPHAKLILETRLAGVAMINQAGDLLSDNLKIPRKEGVYSFAYINGSDKRYKTGSHIDVKGFNLNGGVGVNNPVGSGSLNAGVFFEYGKGNWDSYLDNGASGGGDSRYAGAGAFLQYNTQSNWYGEVSMRTGRVKVDADKGIYDKYSVSSPYLGAHAGLGKRFDVGNNELDLYGKYFYTRTKDDRLTLQGVSVRLDTIHSSRVKIGVKDTIKLNDNHALYAGAAYQYAFNGRENGTVYAVGQVADIASPKLKGSSGIGELGYKYTEGGFEFAVGAKGYVGRERGVGATATMKYTF